MLRIAALDDEQEYLDEIKSITVKCMSMLGLDYDFRMYFRGTDLFDDLDDEEYFDIYFLDMEMPGVSGLDVARQIRVKYIDAVIIYITNYIKYAAEAYEVNTYRYISKEMMKEKLPEVYSSLYEKLLYKEKQYYTVCKHQQYERIPYREIYYLKKEGKNVIIVHRRGESRIRKTIKEIWNEINKCTLFVIIDRAYIVNIMHVMSIKNQQALIRDNSILPVSRARLESVIEQVKNHWR